MVTGNAMSYSACNGEMTNIKQLARDYNISGQEAEKIYADHMAAQICANKRSKRAFESRPRPRR